MLDIEEKYHYYTIPLHEFLRGVIYGDGKYFDPSTSSIANLFDLTTLHEKEHFILALAIGILLRSTGPEVRDGFVETVKIYERLQGMGFTPDQVDSAITRELERNLIETSARQLPEPGGSGPSAMRVTTTGAYHIERFTSEFQHFDAVVVDTPILDVVTKNTIRDAWTIEQRVERAGMFASYLDSHWRDLESKAMGFNWKLASLRLKERLAELTRMS